MKCELADKQCVPCRAGAPPLEGQALQDLAGELQAGWQVVDAHHLQRLYEFKDFRQALDFTNRIGEIAERQGHHPDIALSWGKVVVKILTHKIDGLTESDFVLAAKIDAGE